MREKTQSENIMDHLSKGLPISNMDALQEYGCFRLAARIRELRKDGHDIHMELAPTKSGKRVGVYTLISKAKKKTV